MAKPLINITLRQAITFAFFLVLYEFLTYIANDMIMPGMLKVVTSFHGQESDVANSLTAYILGGASLQLILGPVSDRYGRRVVMIFGACLFFLCTVGIGCSNSMVQFMAGRFFQGMGLCFICVVGYATLQELFAEKDAVRIIALMANVATIAPLLGPLLGAFIVYYASWRLIFVSVGLFALFALWGLWKYMPETVGVERLDSLNMDPVPLNTRTICRNYLILCMNPSYMLGCVVLGLVGAPCIVWIALSPILLVKVAHLSVIQYGLWQIPIFGACILGSYLLSKRTHDNTIEKVIVEGVFALTAGLFLLFLLPFCFGEAYYWMLPGIIFYFFGIGFVTAPLTRFILFSTSVMKGTASALMSMMQMCIQAVGLTLANVLYGSHHNLVLAEYCFGIGILSVLFLKISFVVHSKSLHHNRP